MSFGKLIIIVLVLVGGGVFYYYYTLFDGEIPIVKNTENVDSEIVDAQRWVIVSAVSNAEQKITDVPQEMKGSLVLSVRDTEVSKTGVTPMLLDLGDGSLKRIVPDIDGNVFISGSIHPETNDLIMLLVTRSDVMLYAQLIAVNVNNEVTKTLSSDFVDGVFFTPPITTKNGTIVFALEKNENVSLYNSNMSQNYFVALTDSGSLREHAVRGTNPVAHPQDPFKVLYIGEDGLYTYDTQTGATEILFSVGFSDEEEPNEPARVLLGAANQKISVSEDGKYIGWGNINRREFYVFEIQNWNPFSITLKYKYPLLAFWSQFSPDSRYIAVQTVGEEIFHSGPDTESTVEIFDIETGNRVYIKSLPETYEQTSLWLTDWISI